MNKKQLVLIQDYHYNFEYTLREINKKYDSYLIGISIRSLPKWVNLIKWKTRKYKGLQFGNPISLYRILKNKKKAIIKDFSQPKSLIAILACRMRKIKYIIVVQKMNWINNNFKRIIFKLISIYLIKKNTQIISSTKEGYDDAKKYFNNVEYIPFAIPEKNRKIYDFKANTLKIISVGKLSQKRKNHILLIDTLNEIKLKNKQIELTIIGRKKKKTNYYQKLIQKIKNTDMKITIKSNVDLKSMEKEYLSSDLFILPSDDEPAAYSLLEAMSHGLPVICSDKNGTSNYIQENGFVFKSNKKVSLKEAIIKIAITKDKTINWNNLKKMGEKSIYLVKKNHCPKTIGNKYIKYI